MDTQKNLLQPVIDEHLGQMTEVPLAHYKTKFAEADPLILAARSGIPFTWADVTQDTTQTTGIFALTLLGCPLQVEWPTLNMTYSPTNTKQTSTCAALGNAPDNKVQIIIADLLLNGQLTPNNGAFLSYAEVPWGNHYLKAFQGRCIMRLAYMFKTTNDFSNACEKLGGTLIKSSNPTYEFNFLNGVFTRLTIWEADDEFPPSAQILFSDNAPLAFSAEDLAAVGDIILGALKKCK